jgi:hypothetical protein
MPRIYSCAFALVTSLAIMATASAPAYAENKLVATDVLGSGQIDASVSTSASWSTRQVSYALLTPGTTAKAYHSAGQNVRLGYGLSRGWQVGMHTAYTDQDEVREFATTPAAGYLNKVSGMVGLGMSVKHGLIEGGTSPFTLSSVLSYSTYTSSNQSYKSANACSDNTYLLPSNSVGRDSSVNSIDGSRRLGASNKCSGPIGLYHLI